jgi:hypothetical protein
MAKFDSGPPDTGHTLLASPRDEANIVGCEDGRISFPFGEVSVRCR